jgi:hypothetical protein
VQVQAQVQLRAVLQESALIILLREAVHHPEQMVRRQGQAVQVIQGQGVVREAVQAADESINVFLI